MILRPSTPAPWPIWWLKVTPSVPNRSMRNITGFKTPGPTTTCIPAFSEPLLNLALDLDTGAIRPPLRALAVCLPTDHKHPRLTFDHGKVQSILMAKGASQQDQVSYDALNMFIDIGERVGGFPIHTFRSFRTAEGFTLQGELDNLPDHESANFGIQIPRPLITDCVRLTAKEPTRWATVIHCVPSCGVNVAESAIHPPAS